MCIFQCLPFSWMLWELLANFVCCMFLLLSFCLPCGFVSQLFFVKGNLCTLVLSLKIGSSPRTLIMLAE